MVHVMLHKDLLRAEARCRMKKVGRLRHGYPGGLRVPTLFASFFSESRITNRPPLSDGTLEAMPQWICSNLSLERAGSDGTSASKKVLLLRCSERDMVILEKAKGDPRHRRCAFDCLLSPSTDRSLQLVGLGNIRGDRCGKGLSQTLGQAPSPV